MREVQQEFDQRGFAIVAGIIAPGEAATISRALDRVGAYRAGTRNLLSVPWCRAVVRRIKERLTTAAVFPRSFVAVQCTLFDKSSSRNWLVALHQDLSIPVRARVEHPSLGAWSKKEGGHFVQPPLEVLERLVAARIHVDACGAENGPLKIVSGSHLHGRLSAAAARELRSEVGETECLVNSGDAVLMRPLALHSSSKAQAPARRRVLHIVFGPPSLPLGIEWKHAV